MKRGATLFELLTVLLLAGVGGSMLLGQARSLADVLAVRAAREEVVALFHRARTEARLQGERRLLISEAEGALLLDASGGVLARSVPGLRGVDLRVAGERSEVEVRFGPLGLAGFASATLELERGRGRARLVVSGYGRVRR